MLEEHLERRPDRFKATYSTLANTLDGIGDRYYLSFVGKITSIFLKCLGHLFESIRSRQFPMSQVTWQIYFTGFEAVKLVSIVAALFGSVVVVNALIMMPIVGFGDSFGNITVVVIVREMGPILTAFLVAGRTGAGLATYIGNMRVESEIDALESMGIDPIRFLALPALIGCTISMVILSLLFAAVAMTAGFFCGIIGIKLLHLTIALDADIYSKAIFKALTEVDLFMLVIKPAFFGILISMIACQRGLALKNDMREVPKAASETVVSCFVTVVVSDMLFLAFYIPIYIAEIKSTGFV